MLRSTQKWVERFLIYIYYKFVVTKGNKVAMLRIALIRAKKNERKKI